MSDRRKRLAFTSKFIAYAGAIAVHLLIIGLVVFNYTKKTDVVEVFDADEIDVVNATTIDETQIKQFQEEIRQKDAETKRREAEEIKRLAELKRQAELENDRIDALKKQQEEEKEKALKIEEERKELAEKQKQEKAKIEKEKKAEAKRLAELKKKRAAEEAATKLAEKKASEAKAKAAAEQKKAAEKAKAEEQARLAEEYKKQQEEKKRKETENAFASQLAAEEAKRRTATITSKYASLVTKAINEKRTIAPDFASSLVAKLNIKLSSGGVVKSVTVVESSGNPRYDNDAEKAVRNASPLPIPTAEEDEAAHRKFQDLTINIRMPGA